jgi:hypothetical protein
MVDLISIEDIDGAFNIVCSVEYFSFRSLSCLNQPINCHRLIVVLYCLVEHLVVHYVFWEDSLGPIDNCLVLLIDISMWRIGSRIKRNIVGEVCSEELKAQRNLLAFGGIDEDLVPGPEPSLDDPLVTWLKIYELEFLEAGDIVSELISERRGYYFISLGFAGH